MFGAERQFIEMDWQISLELFIDRKSGLLIRQRLLLLSTLQCSGDQIGGGFVGRALLCHGFSVEQRLLNTSVLKKGAADLLSLNSFYQ